MKGLGFRVNLRDSNEGKQKLYFRYHLGLNTDRGATSDGWTTASEMGRRATSAGPAAPAPAGRAEPAGETGRRATSAAVPAGLALAGGRPLGIGLSYIILATKTLFQPQRTGGF